MKMKLKLFVLLTGILVFAFSCKPKSGKDENLAPNVHKVTAEEVLQTGSYTYILVSEDGTENWIAISKAEVEKGKTYYYMTGMEMSNFTSKELNRTFPSIFFVDKFSDKPITMTVSVADSTKGKQAPVAKEGIKVDPAKGGITIAELYGNKEKYAGQTVKIRGEVVKFSPEIMHRNWAHIQDGTNGGEQFDLTVTTMENVKVGDVVIFEGTVSLKKDFGAGYFYEVIVENARLLKEI